MDQVWLMDDDFFPATTCLEELIKKSDDSKVLFPFMRDKAFKQNRSPGWWGVLIPQSIIATVGYPLKDLFFWVEDTEYLQHRIQDVHQYQLMYVSSAKGVHFAERIKNYRAAWRYYYEIRNMIFSRLYVRKTSRSRLHKIRRSWVRIFGGILLKEKNKPKKIYYFLRGTIHGLRGRIGKTVDPKKRFYFKSKKMPTEGTKPIVPKRFPDLM